MPGRPEGQGKGSHKEVEGERAAEAKVAMMLGNAATNPPKQGTLDIVDVVPPFHAAILLDGGHDLRICQDVIIQLWSVAVDLIVHPAGHANSQSHDSHARRILQLHVRVQTATN